MERKDGFLTGNQVWNNIHVVQGCDFCRRLGSDPSLAVFRNGPGCSLVVPWLFIK